MNIQISAAAQPKKSLPISTKFRCATKDKDKFNDLVTGIAHFTTKLNQLVPHESPPDLGPVKRAALQQTAEVNDYHIDLSYVADLQSLEIILDASSRSHDTCEQATLYKFWYFEASSLP